MSNRKRKTSSIADVAEKAGVSVTTVSRALNDQHNVHPDTRKRVLDEAEALGFRLSRVRPGPKPRAEPERIIQFLHFIDPKIESPDENASLLPIKEGVNRAAAEANVRVAYDVLSTNDTVLPTPLGGGAVVGVLLLGGEPSPQAARALRNAPCCRMMTAHNAPQWGDQVMPDHREVGAMAARHLMERGHTRIEMLALNSHGRLHRLREEGFRQEMDRHPQVSWSATTVIPESDTPLIVKDHEDVLNPWFHEKFVEDPTPPTAIFVDHDRTLCLAYSRLAKGGLVPGRNIGMVSCNNLKHFRESLPVDFNSIDVHFETVGRMSVAQLLWRHRNQDNARSCTLVMPDLNGSRIGA